MADGYLNKCRTCTKKDANNHRSKNIEKIRQYDRERSKNPQRIELHKEQTKMWRMVDKRRVKCHNAVARAIKSGELTRLPCSRCGEVKSLAHHENYDEPLNVVWLCQPCHKERHKEMRIKL
jgi:ribosomal protein S27AE